MSMPFLKPAGLRFVTSQTDAPLKKKDKLPWYVYFIGAAIYYISHATSFWLGTVGILKALVWPAFLVFEALKALST